MEKGTQYSISLSGHRLVGIGIDVVEIRRIARVRSRREILEEVCAEEEKQLFPLSDFDAARLWSGKEAAVKTIGTGFWQQGVDWRDLRFDADFELTLHGRLQEMAPDSILELAWDEHDGYLIATAYRWVPT